MLLPNFDFHDPDKLSDALALKAEYLDNARFIAGGTDLLVHMKKKLVKTGHLINLSKIDSLSQITQDEQSITIGACVTMAQLCASEIIREKFTALQIGAHSLGNHLIRNRATIGGNVCNASPAGDSLCPLLVYDAKVLLASGENKREVPVDKFFTGPGKSQIQNDEILSGFKLPIPDKSSSAHYIQLGKRKSSEINVVNLASYLEIDTDTKKIISAKIALGSVAPTPIRAKNAEAVLKDKIADESLFYKAAETARRQDCKPIDDFRGSAAYRQAMIGVLTLRTLRAAYEGAIGI